MNENNDIFDQLDLPDFELEEDDHNLQGDDNSDIELDVALGNDTEADVDIELPDFIEFPKDPVDLSEDEVSIDYSATKSEIADNDMTLETENSIDPYVEKFEESYNAFSSKGSDLEDTLEMALDEVDDLDLPEPVIEDKNNEVDNTEIISTTPIQDKSTGRIEDVQDELNKTILAETTNTSLPVLTILNNHNLDKFILVDSDTNTILAEDSLFDDEGNNYKDSLVKYTFIDDNNKLNFVVDKLSIEKVTVFTLLKRALILLLLLSLFGALLFGAWKFLSNKTSKPIEPNVNIMELSDISFAKEYENGLEYGSEIIKSDTLIDSEKYSEYSISADPNQIDTSNIGKFDIVYTLTSINNSELTKDFTKQIIISDNTPAEITTNLKDIKLTVGDRLDLDTYLSGVKVADPVDGELKLVDRALTKSEDGTYPTGWYVISNNINVNEPGDYNIVIHAEDKNGNVSEKRIQAVVSEKESKEETTNPTSEPTTQPTNNQTGNTNTNTQTRKCKVKVVDREEVKEIKEKKWIIDTPYQSKQEGKRWVETKPEIPAVTDTVYVVDVLADPEKGIKEKGHYETVIIEPKVPAEGYYETYVIQEEVKEVGHWEDIIIQKYQPEESHEEERDC